MSDLPVDLRRSALSRAFRDPIVPPTGAVRENRSVAFADLVRMMAEGIADALVELDGASADMIVELANSRVSVVRSVTETIKKDGSIEVEASEPVELSLLELGVQPTFYQFSESTIEVAMDLEINEEVETDSSEKSKGRRALFARTRSVREERKLNRDVSVSSKLTAKLVPVPSPVSLDVTRNTIVEEADDLADGGDDDGGDDG